MYSPLFEKFKGTIYLGSQSPRRQQLLNEMGADFEVITLPDLEEIYPRSLTSREIPVYLASHKSRAIWERVEDKSGVLITADTVVAIGERILEKPNDRVHAIQMLSELSGITHAVITGVTLKTAQKTISFSDTTQVTFRRLSQSEIEFYVDNYKPFDKAGAYGIQEWIGLIGVSRINGSYYNVVGLPVEKLYRELLHL